MKTVGIVAEYNPFHNGHRFHIEEAKRLSCSDKAVVIMSASFVQRGEPACADKFTRAKWALDNGADMVIELPDVFALSCAERFASGALRILKGTGIVDALCFGSETGEISAVEEMADAVPSRQRFDKLIGTGSSYPRALSEASGSSPAPNDILGIEYVRANKRYGCGFELYTLKRSTGYDSAELGGEFSSAYAIRTALAAETGSVRMSPSVFDGLCRALPRDVLEDIAELMRRGRFPSTTEGLSDAAIYRLRCMTAEEIAGLPEVSEGLENLFSRYSVECGDLSELLSKVKSKRYTMARLKRTVMCALLGISSELQTKAFEDDSALYARLLGIREDSKELLSMLAGRASLPVVIKASDREKLPETARRIEAISSLAHTLNALGRPYDKSAEPDYSYRTVVR